ncbi:uncharacterized protein LOC119920696 isoform X2 [Tachyglossus aculeatus]|uniref:uncharacterized protein LOC119920696 isoform X2 n=1 Tax=Tachyglossus aculeatus TaxID=9261 RepID=UPI0018F5AF3E|nr:uncharacterized protein LOC119920696 isoform X2 [Tachyglossus aculeatus]
MSSTPTSASGSYSSSSNSHHPRPFFYAQPSPWYPSQIYSPYCVPATGFRNGNPYLPYYSFGLPDYPGFLVSQSSMPARVNCRPYFNPPSPVFYHTARFRQHGTPGKRTETKETQTDARPPENQEKKPRERRTGVDGREAPGPPREPGHGPERADAAVAAVGPEKEFPAENPPDGSGQYRNLSSGSYTFEKEEVRIEYGAGAPAIQLWKSFKETIPLFDVAPSKALPESVGPCDLYSVSSCEGLSVLYDPPGVADMPAGAYPGEPKEDPGASPGGGTQGRALGAENAPAQLVRASVGEAEVGDRPGSIASLIAGQAWSPAAKRARSSGSRTQEEPSQTQEMEADDPQPKPRAQSSFDSPAKSLWGEESFKRYISPPSWLARFDSIDASCRHSPGPAPRKHPGAASGAEDGPSWDEESSGDLAAPDFVVEKSTSAFQKGPQRMGREVIKGSGYLDEELPPEVAGGRGYGSRSRIREAADGGRAASSLKKKATRSPSLSDPEDLEDYWVVGVEEEEETEEDEDKVKVEYLFQKASPRGVLAPGKGGFYRQVGQRVLWKPPRSAASTRLFGWPARDRRKPESQLYSSRVVMHKLKEKEQLDLAFRDHLKRRSVAELEGGSKEGPEPKRTSQKLWGSRLQENLLLAADEFWVRSGAKPKLSSQQPLFSPVGIKEQGLKDGPKRAGVCKPPHKRRDIRQEAEAAELWDLPRPNDPKGYGLRRSSYAYRR